MNCFLNLIEVLWGLISSDKVLSGWDVKLMFQD